MRSVEPKSSLTPVWSALRLALAAFAHERSLERSNAGVAPSSCSALCATGIEDGGVHMSHVNEHTEKTVW